jgi:antitoxin YefM
MTALSYTSLRATLAKVLDRIQSDHTPVLITRKNGSNAVLMSEEDFRSYEETAYLMQSSTNAQRLNDAIAELRSGNGKERELME